MLEYHAAKTRKQKDDTDGHTNGKKRDAKGNIKLSNTAHSAKPIGSIEAGHNTRGLMTRELLLQEILALGGTTDDLDLVADVTSEDGASEKSEKRSKPDPRFAKELSNFIAGLGIEGGFDEDPAFEESEIFEDRPC